MKNKNKAKQETQFEKFGKIVQKHERSNWKEFFEEKDKDKGEEGDKGDKKLSSEYVEKFYDKLRKKNYKGNYKTYSDWKWFKSKSALAGYNQTKDTINKVTQQKWNYYRGTNNVYPKPLKFRSAFELGIGDGIWTLFITDYFKNIDAIDISEEMLSMAKERLAGKNVTFFKGDFMKLKVKKKYDLFYSIRCIEYIADKENLIRKISSMMNKTGEVILITKNPYFFKLRKEDSHLHSEQMWVGDLKKLMEYNGFAVSIIPAIWGKGFHFPIIRNISNSIHNIFLYKWKRRTPINIDNFFVKKFSESFLIYGTKLWE